VGGSKSWHHTTCWWNVRYPWDGELGNAVIFYECVSIDHFGQTPRMARSVEAVFDRLGADDMAVVTLRPSSLGTAIGRIESQSNGLSDLSNDSSSQVLEQLVDDFFAQWSGKV
jgi:hypothetical protein